MMYQLVVEGPKQEREGNRDRRLGRSRSIQRLTGTFVCALNLLVSANAGAKNPNKFFSQTGSDRTFKEIMATGELPKGRDSTNGVQGSVVKVNHELLQDGPNSARKIPRKIYLHTIAHSIIWRSHFSKWSRWYQEDGNTQIFRLFEDETNVRNSRPFAARIEAFSDVTWEHGEWHEWVGTFTILKPHRMIIFQARNNVNDWSVQLNMDDDGNVILNRREGEDEIIADDMVGKPFHVRVRDNGLDYEVYLNGKNVGDGSFARPKGQTCFRWGLYRGSLGMEHDAMMLVTGAAIDPGSADETAAAEVSKDPEEPKEVLPPGLAIAPRVWTNKAGQKVKAAGIYKKGENFFWIKTKGKWIRYPLADLSAADQAVIAEM